MQYPIELTVDGDGFLVTCPALPEVTTDAATAGEAPLRAKDAIEEALAGRLSAFEAVPKPSVGDLLSAPVSLLLALKVELMWCLAENDETRAGLTRRLGWHRNSVDRLFEPRHGTKIEQFDAAFNALSAQAVVEIIASEAA